MRDNRHAIKSLILEKMFSLKGKVALVTGWTFLPCCLSPYQFSDRHWQVLQGVLVCLSLKGSLEPEPMLPA